jgi:putative transposase
MTNPTIALKQYLSNIGLDGDVDFLHDSIQLMTQMLIELEAEEQIGAEKHERTSKRSNHRNGYRPRNWETRVGDIELRIPKLRKGSFYPSLLEPRRRTEKALLAVVQQAYIEGVSTRKVDDLLKALGLTGIDKSKVSRICKELDEVVEQFRNRPLEGEYPYLWLDALYLKVRQNHRIVSLAMVVTRDQKGSCNQVRKGDNCKIWISFSRGSNRSKLAVSDRVPQIHHPINSTYICHLVLYRINLYRKRTDRGSSQLNIIIT